MSFAYARAADAADAFARAAAGAVYVAGGTDLLQLLQEGILDPPEILDLAPLPLRGVSSALDGFRIGALTTLADAAADPVLRERLPALVEALDETASGQVRNMATMGGNLLQRTRCLYFRDVATPCNKREPGSGCPAREARSRMNAILGGGAHCVAVQPSDLAVALVALDAELSLTGRRGERRLRLEEFHRLPGDTPHVETVLEPGEIVASIWIPVAAAGLSSRYFKLRDRASFEWALASVAIAIGLDADKRVLGVRLAAGGVATKPWRLRAVEEALTGHALTPRAIAAAAPLALVGAEPRGRNAFKAPMLEALVARALRTMGGFA